ncbi:hypothetical protein [Verminephrobacter eiseniae]|nr:hypothetical protein [Verminephrobacter eiseniae]
MAARSLRHLTGDATLARGENGICQTSGSQACARGCRWFRLWHRHGPDRAGPAPRGKNHPFESSRSMNDKHQRHSNAG